MTRLRSLADQFWAIVDKVVIFLYLIAGVQMLLVATGAPVLALTHSSAFGVGLLLLLAFLRSVAELHAPGRR